MRKIFMIFLILFCVSSVASSQQGILDFYVKNESGYDIWYIYCSQSGDDTWGNDLLEEIGVLHDGQSVDVTFDGSKFENTFYDVKVIDEFDDETVLYNIDLSSIWGIAVYNDHNWQLQARIEYIR